ncbi:hypothetical protein [Rhizobium sp. NXC24]|uniref:hypothetical protein n=1 Tax=Rhizobium sp. NXC24 TaxID=2048897 RepID=UPI000CDF50F2|nr:hypothetical protein [Rhizobium sp. NXC24]AVA20657.1 hypothetical protein NXC24_CH00990 [Rhizobium sp. NXC24]
MRTIVFPYHRRRALIDKIADTFVNEGLQAGNSLAFLIGAQMVSDLLNNEAPQADVDEAITLFVSAWRTAAIPRLVEQQRKGGAA